MRYYRSAERERARRQQIEGCLLDTTLQCGRGVTGAFAFFLCADSQAGDGAVHGASAAARRRVRYCVTCL